MARTISQYISYSFREHDPIIDQMRTMLADENASYGDVNIKSGVAVSTLHNWFKGKTKRPQFATIMAVSRSLGYDLVPTKIGGKVIKFKRNIRAKVA